MKLIKLNGCVHVFDGERFAKRSFGNVAKAVGTFAYGRSGKAKSVKEIINTYNFGDSE